MGFLFLEGLFLSVKREPLASWEEGFFFFFETTPIVGLRVIS